jgi:chromosomal replication initiator protein
LQFVIDPQLFQATRAQQSQAGERRGVSPTCPSGVSPTSEKRPRRRWLQLDDFLVGPCNRLAHAAVLHLLERPDDCPNPTFLWGPPGIGKTHLLEAICVEFGKTLGEASVLCLSAEEFTNQFLHAVHEQRMAGFRRQFRELHALCIDDVHFLAKKKGTQEELLHTFEALRRMGRPVALTAAVHPAQLADFLPELRDRLLGGGVWDIEPPDVDTRRKLLRAKSARLDLPLPEDVLEYLAGGLRGNVRELEGALHHLHQQARVHRRPVTLELARAATGHLIRGAARPVALGDIELALEKALHLDPRQLRKRSRSRGVSHPRMLAIFLARKHTAASYAEISQHFGSANHTTALAAEKKVRQWLETDASLVLDGRPAPVKDLLERIEREL